MRLAGAPEIATMAETICARIAFSPRRDHAQSKLDLANCADRVFASSISGAAISADLVVAMPNWPSGQAGANIIKYGIEEKLGLKVDVRRWAP